MNISNYYWYFKDALSHKFCDDLVQYGLQKKRKLAMTGDLKDKKLKKSEIKELKKIRDSSIVWLNDPWIYKKIHPFVHEANKNSGWNYEWDYSEACQFTVYKPNQHYDWHCDDHKTPSTMEGHEKGKIRKLSVTCQLTDRSEYTGGELEFDCRNYDPSMRDESKHVIQANEAFEKGSIIVFPSWVWHRVKPVITGTRHSLVMWNMGYPFK